MQRLRRLVIGAAVLVSAHTPIAIAAAQQIDAEYTAKIRELTPTDPKWKFTTELVDHLPASRTVPSPLKVLGYVPGTIGRLAYVEELNRYFRAVAAASPRVKVFSLGLSDEGREMIVAAVADENTIKRLDDYRGMLAKLADPRTLKPGERAKLVREAKPAYWLTGSIHSPEIGSPEMLMELLYRLAVEETPFVQSIRANVITLITPATEVDGRDRAVDALKLSRRIKANVGLPYWGRYTAHDNNRDGIGLSQKLSQNMANGFYYWHPTVMHDLHESVAFMHISTGTGPYNDEFDPIVIDEWHTLAYNEITELTKRGLPGVWTHGFYDGWASNYMMGVAQFHNSIGRFYETYTSTNADCQTTNFPPGSNERRWDRPSVPVSGVKWCMRSNLNYQQSGVLLALKYTADHRETFLDNFVTKGERMVEKGKREAPYAYVIPRDQRHAAEAADLVNLFRMHGAEVHVASQDFPTRSEPKIMGREGSTLLAQNTSRVTGAGAAVASGNARRGAGAGRGAAPAAGDSAVAQQAGATTRGTPVTVHAGDWVIRMDQPYAAMVRTLLALQHFKVDDPSPYDDTGWTLDELRHVATLKIVDSTVLSKPMQLLAAEARIDGAVVGTGDVVLVPHLGDWRSAVLPWRATGGSVAVADSAFSAGGQNFAAGTFIVSGGNARAVVAQLGLKGTAVTQAPTVKSHTLSRPRIAYVHSWLETQNEGWWRFALDQMTVPYTYMSDQALAAAGALDNYDVLVFPHVSGNAQTIVNGRPMVGPPIPWKKTAETPNLGKVVDAKGAVWLDETDDMRKAMGLEGLAAIGRFVDRGGLLVTEGNSTRVPIDFGLTPGVTVAATPKLFARGAVFRAQEVTRESPILYGYDQQTFSVYFNQAPLFNVQAGRGGGPGGGGGDGTPEALRNPQTTADQARMQPRVILRFHQRADSLLVSGGLDAGDEMAGKAALVDAPLGKGHVVMFGIRPMWRWETQGTFALVLNALANWNALDVNRRAAPEPETASGSSY